MNFAWKNNDRSTSLLLRGLTRVFPCHESPCHPSKRRKITGFRENDVRSSNIGHVIVRNHNLNEN